MNKRIIMALVLLTAIGGYMQAQENKELTGPDLSGDMTPAPAEQRESMVGKDGKAEWYVNMDYAGFEFELPAGVVVDKGPKLVARYPDGSFGLSMVNEAGGGTNQKIAFELCRRIAKEQNIPDMKVEKVKYGKCSGAKASGEADGIETTILVLPYDSEQVTAVLMCTPQRSEWVNHFLRTLKR